MTTYTSIGNYFDSSYNVRILHFFSTFIRNSHSVKSIVFVRLCTFYVPKESDSYTEFIVCDKSHYPLSLNVNLVTGTSSFHLTTVLLGTEVLIVGSRFRYCKSTNKTISSK